MPTAATGRILAGRYRLISQLGVGGMGITYRAWDDVNAVPVVVKMPKREAQSDQEALRRFAREIDAMLALPHDHIVPITDHGEQNGCPYVVMRFLPGGSLADHRRRDDDGNPLANPAGMLHFWLPAVADALDFIHQKGVLHRDIKPGNIFFDGFWNAFLGDFGIAKVVDSSAGLAKEQTITATMIAIGTPEYMAPELFSPKGKPDGRADQYALAVTVYEMLCGVKPFTGAKAHIVVEHSGMPVPPLQNKGLGIPMSLCVAVERALAKTPPERFGACAEFARAALRGVPALPSEPDTARLMCPSCAKILRMPTSASGQWGKCPSCKVAMRVAPGLSALWLRNEEFVSSGPAGDASVDTDFKESSEKPKGLFSKLPAVAGWASLKARELSQKLLAIPPWASLALLIAGAAIFVLDRGASVSDAMKAVEVQKQLVLPKEDHIHQESQESAATQPVLTAENLNAQELQVRAALHTEIQSLRQHNKELQTKVDFLKTEVYRLKKAASEKSKPEEQAKISLKTVVNSIGMTLVEIPAGKFRMGEGPSAVAVTLTRPFLLGKTEVTRGQWEQVWGTKPWVGSDVPSDDLPAVDISWDIAIGFCEKLTAHEHSNGTLQANEVYRLPTEAEWEYACRAGTTTAFSFGDDESMLGDFDWFAGNAGNAVHSVGTKQPNPWGLYDMHGNVWEWCSDWFDVKLAGGADPVGPAGGSARVFRGGHWKHNPVYCRSALRYRFKPLVSNDRLGFRVARGRPLQPVASNAATETPKDTKQPAPEMTQPKLPLKSVVDSVGIELLEIYAGKFQMGERSDAVPVTLTRPFWMGKTEVTRGQWKRVMKTTPWGDSAGMSDDDLPVVGVSWDEATDFCRRLTARDRSTPALQKNEVYRLPTEAEWEYACRAGTTTKFSFGDDDSQLGDFGWFVGGNSGGSTHPVGTKKPNSWGLHDMHGNVWEWCSDWYGETLTGGVDPVGPSTGIDRVLRGGSSGLFADHCSSRFRYRGTPHLAYGNPGPGFRLVRAQSAK
jgi:formylglycine-generating enzyme required for sulfatase activity